MNPKAPQLPFLQTTLSIAMLVGWMPPAYAAPPVVDDHSCFFQVAEVKFPSLLNPSNTSNKQVNDGGDSYIYRDYNNGVSLAIKNNDSVWLVNKNTSSVENLGGFSQYLRLSRDEFCDIPSLEIKENYGVGGFRPWVASNEYRALIVSNLLCFDKKTNQQAACEFSIKDDNSAIEIIKENGLNNVYIVDYLVADTMDFMVVATNNRGGYAERKYTIYKTKPFILATTPTPVTCSLPQVLTNGVCVTPTPTPPPVSASNLLDTGITSAQCYAAGSDALVSCTSAAAIALNDKQDGMVGLDVTSPSNSDGKLGFSYSTVGSYPLIDCVKDNRTGLVWEGKPTTGVRAAGNTYTNYGDGRAGDASAYVNTVNATSLCGYTDWRLPTATELQSIVDYGVPYPGPTIDTTWFVNTPNYAHWTSTAYVGNSSLAWCVIFGNGNAGLNDRDLNGAVRVVR